MAVRFNGTNDGLGVTAPPNVLNNVTRATIMAWCRPNGPVTGSPTVFAASIGPPPGLSGSSRLSIDRQNPSGPINITVRAADGAGGFGLSGGSGNDYFASEWQHVAAVIWYDNNVGSVYRNAVLLNGYTLMSLSALVTSATNPKALAAGANEDFLAGFWNGDIEDCRIYNRALSQEELETIVAAKGADGIVNGLQVRYPMTDGPPGSTVVTCANVIRDGDIDMAGPLRPLSGAPVFSEGIIRGPRNRSSISIGY